jgi:hypothetical protein
MSHEIRKTTNCDSNTKGLSYGLLDYVFNLAAGRNIGLKMSKQNILFKANSLILMNLKKKQSMATKPAKKHVQGFPSSPFGLRRAGRVQRFWVQGSKVTTAGYCSPD